MGFNSAFKGLKLLQYSVSVLQLSSMQVSLLVLFPFLHFMVE
jgi:hypothetical protein